MHEVGKVVCGDCGDEFDTVDAWESHRFKTGVIEELERLAGEQYVKSRFYPVVEHYSKNSDYIEEGDLEGAIHAFCKAESVDPERDGMVTIARACVRYTAGYTEDLMNSGSLDRVVSDTKLETPKKSKNLEKTGSEDKNRKESNDKSSTEPGYDANGTQEKLGNKDDISSKPGKGAERDEKTSPISNGTSSNGSESHERNGSSASAMNGDSDSSMVIKGFDGSAATRKSSENLSEEDMVVRVLAELARQKGSEKLDWGEIEIPYDEIREKVESDYGHELSSSKRGANVRIGNIVKELGLEKKRTREGAVVHDPSLRSKIEELGVKTAR